MTAKTQSKDDQKDILNGLFFHSFKNKKNVHGENVEVVKWQGYVVGKIQDGIYLVQLYEWLVGNPSNRIIVTLDTMMREGWTFYSSAECWNEAGDKLVRHADRVDPIESMGGKV